MKRVLGFIVLPMLAAMLAAAPGPEGSPAPAPPVPVSPPQPAPAIAPPVAAHGAVSSSMIAHALADHGALPIRGDASASTPSPIAGVSLFAVSSPQARQYNKHDLVQIIVRQTSQTKRSQDLDTTKKYKLDGKVTGWPDFQLAELLNLQLHAGRTSDLPKVGFDVKNDFKGEGEYSRRDDMTDRLTASVVDVLPNGNLVLEARTSIKTDAEESTMKVTGICRAADVTAANTLLSTQIFDLKIENMHKGDLKDSSQKGIIAKVLDTVFAF